MFHMRRFKLALDNLLKQKYILEKEQMGYRGTYGNRTGSGLGSSECRRTVDRSRVRKLKIKYHKVRSIRKCFPGTFLQFINKKSVELFKKSVELFKKSFIIHSIQLIFYITKKWHATHSANIEEVKGKGIGLK